MQVNMMRSVIPRATARPLWSASHTATRPSLHSYLRRYASTVSNSETCISRHAKPLALTAYRQNTALVRRHASTAAPGTFQRPEKEAKFASERLQVDTEAVTTTSSTAHIVNPNKQQKQEEEEVDMLAGIKHDFKVIQDTFAFDEVPKQAYRIGLAGVLPYLATSTATVACAFEVGYAAQHNGLGLLMHERTAELCLHVLEPLQVGYGAVILSFLGAIHWGLEWAGYGGDGGWRRYSIGVIAPAVAWPTVLLPVEYALISQFLAFNFLYAVDSDATSKGLAPPWYASYRFVLTFIVGVSIVLSLIGRGRVQDLIGKPPAPADRVKELRQHQKERKKKVAQDQDLE